MVADAYPVSPGNIDPCGAQGQLNECGSAICGGAPSLVHRLLSRCLRFVAVRTRTALPSDNSVNHRAA